MHYPLSTKKRSMRPKSDQNFWNFLFSVVFAVLLFTSMWSIESTQGSLPSSIPLFDLVLIIFAVLRLSRLFVYDKITEFIRDLFLRKQLITAKDGTVLVDRFPYERGPLRTISDLLNCPWCVGVWAALGVLYFYFITPLAWYVILFLAVAGVASFIQLLTNMIGWRAEYLKMKAGREKEEIGHC